MVGFDEDRRDAFLTLAQWIEVNRLECATFHILTPYPGTPLYRDMEAQGRLLHRDWSLYDTAHVVFRPRHLSPGELAAGYAWLHRRLFSHASIWRRPEDTRAELARRGDGRRRPARSSARGSDRLSLRQSASGQHFLGCLS